MNNPRDKDFPVSAVLLKSLREHVLHYSDQEVAANIVDSLLTEIHELRRTRSEAEARAVVRGYRQGMKETQRQVRGITGAPWQDWEPHDTVYE